MANIVAIGNNGVVAPINGPLPQIGVRNVVQLNQGAPPVLLQAIDQARAGQVQIQRRLEGQVQQGEVALFQAAQRNAELGRQLNQAVNDANEQRNRANGLEGHLAVERQQRAHLAGILRQAQDQEHILRGEAENAVRFRDDIQRRLDASDARIGALEQQIANERAEAHRRDRLKDLQVNKAQLETAIENVSNPQITVMVSGTVGGLAVGGILGGFIGFVGSLGACFISPCAAQETEFRRQLSAVTKEIAQITPNGGNP